MKKLAIVLTILMLAPASAFGMQMLTDSGMAQITGQSGVSIAMDDVQLFINIDRMAYIDNDGLSTSATMQIENDIGAPGALYIQDFQIDVLNINAIVGTVWDNKPQTLNLVSTSAGHIPLFYDYASTAPLGGGHLRTLDFDPVPFGGLLTDISKGDLKGLENYTNVDTNSSLHPIGIDPPFIANAITIEVTDKLPALTQGFNYNAGAEQIAHLFPGVYPPGAGFFWAFQQQNTNVGGVFITMPTAEIYIQDLSFTVAYTGDVTGNSLESIGLPWGTNDLYMGPLGPLTSHAVNNNGRYFPPRVGDYYYLEGDYGSIDIQGITFTQLSGWMEIAPH